MQRYTIARWSRALSVVVAGLLGAPVALHAQAACTIDTARARVETDVIFTLRRMGDADTTNVASVADHLLLAQDLKDLFEAPTSLTFRPWSGTISTVATETLVVAPEENFALEVASDGGLASFVWLTPPSSPELTRAVEAAVRTLGDRRALPASVPGRRGPVRFAFRLGQRTSVMGLMEPKSVALFRAKISALQLDREAAPKRFATLEYPKALRQAGIEGYADLEYVVTAAGRVDPDHVRVLVSSNPSFALSAVTTILDSEFEPAQIQRCPAPSLVRQRLSFRLR